MVQKICQNCGKQFTTTNQNKNQPCCNIKCKKELTAKKKTKVCTVCKGNFIPSHKHHKCCSKECSTISMTIHDFFNCRHCGVKAKWLSKNKNIYCSKSCFSAYAQSKPLKQTPIKTFSVLKQSFCIDCNKEMLKKRTIKRCVECINKYNATARIKTYYKNMYGKETSNCKICSKEINLLTSKSNIYCSSECAKVNSNKNAHKHRGLSKHIQRAKKHNCKYEAGVTLYQIRKRDGNNCLICGEKVLSKNISGYSSKNATIGHIQSLCNGGSHCMQNVQLECADCNYKKGRKNGGQLRLF